MRTSISIVSSAAIGTLGLVLAISSVPGCTPDIPEGRFVCSLDSDCPSGWSCRNQRCFSGEEGQDASIDASVDAAMDGSRTDGGPGDGGGGPCTRDLDCSNGVFCDGVETCDPSASGADPTTGCVAAASDACVAPQTCDETNDRCVSDCTSASDADHDGHDAIDCAGDDCNDADPNVFPGHAETCDAVDDDCDPTTLGTTDLDGDGAIASACCNPSSGGNTCGPDCDDALASVGSGDAETCDGLDNDCNGMTDDGVLTTYYLDADGDTYGQTSMTMTGCATPSGYASMSGDCDDTSAAVHPGATETCNLVDDDCSGVADDGISCACTDGTMQPCGSDVGACMLGMQSCVGGRWGTCSGDTGPSTELCNNADDDCDTLIDDGAAASCATRANTTPSCSSGACRYTCMSPFQTCDSADPGDGTGCESNSLTDVNHCGGCTACATPTNVTARACASGACAIVTCNSRFADCDGAFSNGCERPIDTVADCGSCGNTCPARPGSMPACSGAACSFTCNSGFSDCDGNAVNGCETALPSCDAPPPRLIGPLTSMVVTSNRPELRFAAPSGTTMAQVDVCRDPGCGSIAWTGTGTSPITVGMALTPGRYYWRARTVVGTTVGTVSSATWNFVTFAQTTPTVATDAFPYLNVAGGVDDLAIGEPSTTGGRVLFYDAAGTTVTQTLNAPASRPGFGSSIASVDVNGDGYVDLVVGACMADPTSSTAPTASTGCSGYVVVYPGDSTGRFSSTPLVTLGSGNGSGKVGFGYSVGSVGDFNGDGYGDFVVGAYWSNAAFVYLGRATASTLTEVDLTYGTGTSRYGSSVAGAGDVDGDHFDDVIIGSINGLGSGQTARVVFGIASGTPTTSSAAVAASPSVVSGLGDVDGDGRADVAVASPTAAGTVIAYRGVASRAIFSVSNILWTLTGSGSTSSFGAAVIGPGDMDGDGLSDVVVGSPGTLETYVYAGNTGSLIWRTADSGSAFGRTVGRAGLLGGTTAAFVVATCGNGTSGCTAEVTLWNGGASSMSLRGVFSGTSGTFFGAGLPH